jgi:glyceraldehyde 3-phosphate dehydrogenase
MRIAINGLGRIGRAVLRLLTTTRSGEGLEIVHLNDIARPELCAYLIAHDSVYGPFNGTVSHEDQALIINGQRFPLTSHPDPRDIDLSGVDLLLDCTGKASDRAFAERALQAGAKRVLISGPCSDADLTVVLGANDTALKDQQIVSNASCTTNALAPLLRILDDAFGLETGHMTTIHCYTGSQPTVDAPRGDLVRSRAAGLSMVPTTTSASRLTDSVLPHLAGRVEGRAVRVPTASVSAIDLTVKLNTPVTAATVNALFETHQGAILGLTPMPLVSADLRMRPESIVMDRNETTVTSGGLLRVFGWYDNEWGFSNRMIDVALRMRP